MTKVNNIQFVDQIGEKYDLTYDKNNPDLLIIYSDIPIDPTIFNIETSFSSKKDSKDVIAEFDRVTKEFFDFLDNYEGKPLLVVGSAVFLLAKYLFPDLEDHIFSSKEHLNNKHKLVDLNTNTEFMVNSNHSVLIDSMMLEHVCICDPIVSQYRDFPYNNLLPDPQNESLDVEVFQHVYKSITFCIPDLLKENNQYFIQHIFKISKEYIQ